MKKLFIGLFTLCLMLFGVNFASAACSCDKTCNCQCEKTCDCDCCKMVIAIVRQIAHVTKHVTVVPLAIVDVNLKQNLVKNI